MKKPVDQMTTKRAGTRPRQIEGRTEGRGWNIGRRRHHREPRCSCKRRSSPSDIRGSGMAGPLYDPIHMLRRLLILATLGIAVLAVAYTVYWLLLARTVDRDIAAWVGFYRQQGYRISFGYSRSPLAGFPFAVRAGFL